MVRSMSPRALGRHSCPRHQPQDNNSSTAWRHEIIIVIVIVIMIVFLMTVVIVISIAIVVVIDMASIW